MLVHALSEMNEKDKLKMMKIVGNERANQHDVRGVIDMFRTSGSIDFAQSKLKEYSDTAKRCLDIVDSSESKNILIELADYSVTRMY